MGLSRDEAERLLNERPRRKGREGQYTAEERKRRQRAMTAANIEASRAVARLHPDEFKTFYEVAVEQRLAAEGF